MRTTDRTPAYSRPEQPAHPERRSIVVRVSAALDQLTTDHHALVLLPYATPTGRAERAERIALLLAREAGLWGVLLTDRTHLAVPPLYRRAFVTARERRRDDARYWRTSAAQWRAIAAERAAHIVAEAVQP